MRRRYAAAWWEPILLILVAPCWVCGQQPDYRAVRKCATCHPAQAKPQPATSMAHALETIAECAILREHPVLKFKQGPYSYLIERRGEESVYSVSEGPKTFSV
ncbi:MAG: hypothetical protein JO061_00920, partial [Acidobacteriaceae bacterium]|nr:hypothetical protein [Acidobacteriaceae bacterium]